jgi:hypothetical protein
MITPLDTPPDDVERLRVMVLAERTAHAAEKAKIVRERDIAISENDRLTARNERLDHIISVLRRARFGRSSERIDDEQLNLVLENVETAFAAEDAAAEDRNEIIKAEATKRRRANRGHLPAHLPREEVVVEPKAESRPWCGGALHAIGETERAGCRATRRECLVACAL